LRRDCGIEHTFYAYEWRATVDGAATRIIGTARWSSGASVEGEVDAAVRFGARPKEGSMVTVDGRSCRILRVGPIAHFPDVYLAPGEVPVHLTVEAVD
jgi:hypothetical protein